MKNRPSPFVVTIILLLTITTGLFSQDKIFKEYETKAFTYKGRSAKIVSPEKTNKQRSWVWRARFWGHEPQLDKALLEKGFHVVYLDVAGLFGNNEAVNLWNDYYDYLIDTYQLNSKVVLEGMSRGGLIIYNWAAQNTKKVSCIYADAPVCDIKSWPGGLYQGKGSPSDWEACLKAYNLDENSVMEFKGIPLNTAIEVAKANISVIHVCGDADKVVPYEENSKILSRNFKDAGGDIELIVKKGVGHHPHSLTDPTPILDFILKHTRE